MFPELLLGLPSPVGTLPERWPMILPPHRARASRSRSRPQLPTWSPRHRADRPRRAYFVQDALQPRASTHRVPKCQEFVPCREGRRGRNQKMLDVVKLKHRRVSASRRPRSPRHAWTELRIVAREEGPCSPSPAGMSLLHQVEHSRKCCLKLEGLFDLIGRNKRVLPIFQEARTLMITNKPDECRRVRLPVGGKAF